MMRKSLVFLVGSFFFVAFGLQLLFSHQDGTSKQKILSSMSEETLPEPASVLIPPISQGEKAKPRLIPKLELNSDQEKLSFEIPILMFHYIQDIPSTTKDQLGYKLSYAPQKLEELLIFLKDHEIETLTFWELKSIIEGEKKLPEKAVILSFDDGHKDHYTQAFPLLKKHGSKAVFFIITDKAESDPKFANWTEIKEMADAGFEIGSHSVSHAPLPSLAKGTINHEVAHSKAILEEKIGKPIISFCYPAGRYDQRVLNSVRENYLFARTTQAGSILKVRKRHQLPTIRMNPNTKIKNLVRLWEI